MPRRFEDLTKQMATLEEHLVSQICKNHELEARIVTLENFMRHVLGMPINAQGEKY